MERRGEPYVWTRPDLKPAPLDWEPCQRELDLGSGHWPGWVPVNIGPDDQYHREAWDGAPVPPDGTYELVGPKIQGNPYGLRYHMLMPHGGGPAVLLWRPEDGGRRTFETIKSFLEGFGHEGIVFHHPDGRMAKIRRRDFGFRWPLPGDLATTEEPIR
jgi:hypothetical protein